MNVPAPVPPQIPEDDALDLTLRLVLHLFGRTFETQATATWAAPGAVVLLGGRPGGPTLAVPTRWGARVAGRPRDDGMLEVAAVHRLRDRLRLDLATSRCDEMPGWAARIPRLAAALLPHGAGGASLLAYMDVPDESGILAEGALHGALALALSEIASGITGLDKVAGEGAGSRTGAMALIAALNGGGDGDVTALASSLLGRYGYAMMMAARLPSSPLYARFDPGAAGLRLVVISARPIEAGVAPQRWTPDPSDDDRVAPGFEATAGRQWATLGSLLTASHQASRNARGVSDAGARVESDLAVESAMATGALGGRATSPATALVLMPTRSLGDLRAGVAGAFAERALPAPRFLTTGALPPAVTRLESLLLSEVH